MRTSECFWWFTFVYRGPHTNQKAKLVKPTHGRLFGFHDVIRSHTRSPKLRTCPGRKIAQIKMTKPKTAWRFYTVFALSMAAGMTLYFLKINAIKALYWSAIINGLLAPFLLVAIVVVASDARLMKKQPSSKLALFSVSLTALLMFGAAIGMFFF